MSERVALVVNVEATRVRPALRRRVVAALTPLGLAEELEAGRHARAGDLARVAAEHGATVVVALGGDGTVNDVAAALADSSATMLPLAGGSTNVFTRAMGWPHPAGTAIPLIAPALAQRSVREVRLGRIAVGDTSRPFCVNAGMGIDANTVQAIEERRWMKQLLRQVGFGLISVAEAVRSARRAPCIRLSADGGEELLLASAIVAVGSPYAYVGPRPLDLAPGATFDGRLRWLGIAHTSPRELSAVIRGGLGHGAHLGRDGVYDGWATEQVVLRADRPIAVQADGEPLGRHREATVTPGPTLRVLEPPPD